MDAEVKTSCGRSAEVDLMPAILGDVHVAQKLDSSLNALFGVGRVSGYTLNVVHHIVARLVIRVN